MPYTSSCPEVFLEKSVLRICSKFTREHPCQSVILINLLCNFIEIALWHGCSLVNLLHIFRTPFPRNSSEWLLLAFLFTSCVQGETRRLALNELIGILDISSFSAFYNSLTCRPYHFVSKYHFKISRSCFVNEMKIKIIGF